MKMNTREEIEQKIRDLKCSLSDGMGNSIVGDWNICQYLEYKEVGKEAPFDINEYHRKKEAVREEINRLEEELKSLIENENSDN